MWFGRGKAGDSEPAADRGEETLAEAPLHVHLKDLRDCLLRSICAVLIVFVLYAPFARSLYGLLAAPMMQALAVSPDGGMIATHPTSPFFAPFRLSFYLALYTAMPVALYQVSAFVAPGLYRHERRLALALLASSIVLFYCGMVFAYFVVFPLMFGFFVGMTPEGVVVATDITLYLDFVLGIFLAFGLAFEMPVAVLLITRAGFTSVNALASYRPYVFLGCFVGGMLMTPADAMSQTLLAVPMYLLYELGMIMSRVLARPGDDTGRSKPV